VAAAKQIRKAQERMTNVRHETINMIAFSFSQGNPLAALLKADRGLVIPNADIPIVSNTVQERCRFLLFGIISPKRKC
jgi:hypothetical protein